MRLHAQTAIIESGFVYLPREAPWLAEYLHELTTFPAVTHKDQADSTAQALAWIKECGREPALLQYLREEADKRRRGPDTGPLVRFKGPTNVNQVLTRKGRAIWMREDGIFEMHEVDAKPLLCAGWVKL